jgi:hypothetical protein
MNLEDCTEERIGLKMRNDFKNLEVKDNPVKNGAYPAHQTRVMKSLMN